MPACQALDAPLELVVEIDHPDGQQPVARIYRYGVLVFDGVSSALPDAGEHEDVGDVSSRAQVAAVVVERTGRTSRRRRAARLLSHRSRRRSRGPSR